LTDKKNLIKDLKLNSVTDFRIYIVNKLLELSESEKPEHSISALKELSKHIFFPEQIFENAPIERIFNRQE